MESGPCHWRVTCHGRSWADLCERLNVSLRRSYSGDNGFCIRADAFAAARGAPTPNDFWSLRVYRGLSSGFLVGCWFTGQDPSGDADVVRLTVGRSSRLDDWAFGLTVFPAFLLTVAVVLLCLYPFSPFHWLASPPFLLAAVGSLALVMIGVTFFLSWLVFGVATRLFMYPVVTVAGCLEGNRLSDREIEAAVELVRRIATASSVIQDGW